MRKSKRSAKYSTIKKLTECCFRERIAKFGRKDKDSSSPTGDKDEEVNNPVSSDSDSEDFELIQNFSEKKAKDILFSQLNYTKIILE